jgi:hypothetical protein
MSTETVTYGGFHRPKPFGILWFGTYGTIIAIIAAFITIALIPTLGSIVAIVFALVTGSVLSLMTIKDKHHQSWMDKYAWRRGYRKARKSGSVGLLSGSLTPLGSHVLPGVLSETDLHKWSDKNGNDFTILRYPKEKLYVVNIMAEPDGASLIDPEDLTDYVTRWGEFLAGLAYEGANLVQAAVTFETSQDSGPTLTLEMNNHRSDKASPLSKQWADSVLKEYPKGTTVVRAYISATFAAPRDERDLEGNKIKGEDPLQTIGRLVADRLPQMLDDLPETGAGTVIASTTEDLVRDAYCMYNPDKREIYDDLESKGEPDPVMLWNSVGPTGSYAHKDYYEHSGYGSVVWETSGFISTRVISKVLLPILEPTPLVTSKRITWLYKPIDPAFAGAIAETDHRAAEGRITNATKPTARQFRDLKEADEARSHEAHGAALMNFAILVSATAKIENLASAKTTVAHQGQTARLVLRLMRGSMDSAFAQSHAMFGLVTEKHLSAFAAMSKGI